MKHARGHAIAYDGATTITYEWPCGHQRKHDYSKGPIPKRVGTLGCRMLARWHSKERGGVNLGPCPTCERRTQKLKDGIK